MFESFADLFPPNWRPAILIATAPFRWLAAWQGLMVQWVISHSQTAGFIAAEILLIVPVLLDPATFTYGPRNVDHAFIQGLTLDARTPAFGSDGRDFDGLGGTGRWNAGC